MTAAGEIYCHWFAAELYNLSKKVDVTASSIDCSVKMKDSTLPLAVQRSSLDCFVDDVVALSSLPDTQKDRGVLVDPSLRSSELTSTALLCRAFDRFLFPDQNVGACVHQLPVYCSSAVDAPERGDFSVVALDDHMPGMVLGCTDFKLTEMPEADVETLGYSVRLMSPMHNPNKKYLMKVCFPMTRFEIKLHLAIGGRIMAIEVLKAFIQVSDDLKKFACVLYAAVHGLLYNSLSYSTPCISPTRTLTLWEHPDISNEGLDISPYRVYKCDSSVYKLYDTYDCKPNIDLMKKILPEAQVVHLTEDMRYQYLKYQYQEGSSIPSKLCQFADILTQLSNLHEQGYVHSDVRASNIVFSKDSDKAFLLDLDLVGKEDERYPLDFNHCTGERHTGAHAGHPRRKEHDCYSLGLIMVMHKVPNRLALAVMRSKDLSKLDQAVLQELKSLQ